MSAQEPVALALANRLQEITLDRASPRAKRMATSAIVDTVAVTLAGASEPCTTLLAETLAAQGGQGPALLMGQRQRVGVLDAAHVNGTAAHAIDFDDMAEAMGGHPSVPVVPVVFALGEMLGATGSALLEAYIVGVEAECRIGRVVNPHHYERGWHPTSTLGVFGAAAAAARLLKLEATQTATAFGIAASMASGVKANFGTMTKPLQVGHTARNGLLAALLVQRGYTGNPATLEHPQGFFASFDGLSHVHIERLFDHWGELLEIEQPMFGLKQFPCCGSTHPAIMSMLELREREGVRADDVESIQITAHRRRLPHTNNPRPTTPLGAKFSIQYATVRALLDGPPRIADFEGDRFLQPQVQRLLDRTTVEAYPVVTEELQDEMAAEVSVVLRDGRSLTGRANALGRGPANPMSEQEMWQKFSDCASSVLPATQAEQAFAALNRIAEAVDTAALARLLQAPPR